MRRMKRLLVSVALSCVLAASATYWTAAHLIAQKPLSPSIMRTGEVFTPIEAPNTFKVHPATQGPAVKVTMADLKRWEAQVSNWGRWGPDDQRGTLNLITPEKTRQAAGLVKDGVSVLLQHFVEWKPGIDSWRATPAERWNTSAGIDAWSFGLHDGTLSHMDALCHYWGAKSSPSARTPGDERVIFNGYPFRADEKGCQDLALDRMGPGYVTRGILFDMPLLKGVEWLEPSTPIFVSDLEAWEKFAGVKIGPGDVLLVRAGRWAKRSKEGPWNYADGGAGLHASVVPWLHARGVALLVGDAVNDVQPSGVEGINRPVHQMSIVLMGLPTVDNGYLEDVAREARARKRWEFMVSWQNWKGKGLTASPWNALATF
jgi:putative cyclase